MMDIKFKQMFIAQIKRKISKIIKAKILKTHQLRERELNNNKQANKISHTQHSNNVQIV